MSESFDEWLAALPDMEGQEPGVKKLLKGVSDRGGTWWVVVDARNEGYFFLGYIDPVLPDKLEIVTTDNGPRQRFTVVERYGEVTLDRLADYVKGETGWEYDLSHYAEEAAQIFVRAQAINEETWDAHVAQVFAGLPADQYWRNAPKPPGNLHGRVKVPLTDYVYYLRGLDDPRAFVADFEREAIQETLIVPVRGHRGLTTVGSKLLLTIRPDIVEAHGITGVRRKLAAVLPGAEVQPWDEDESRIVVEQGTFKHDAWAQLDKDTLNERLVSMPNDPVVKVSRGNFAMQTLLVLVFAPNQAELDYIAESVGAEHVALAEPANVYGPRVVSLVTTDDEEDDLESWEESLRRALEFL